MYYLKRTLLTSSICYFLARKAYFDKAVLTGFRNIDSNLQGHPDMRKNSRSRHDNRFFRTRIFQQRWEWQLVLKWIVLVCRVYCLVGDGEIEEGQIWGGSNDC